MQTLATDFDEPVRHLRRTLDPYGMTSASLEVQQAWLRQPAALFGEMAKLNTGVWDLHFQVWRRMTGIPASDAIPASPYDERFRDPIWTENPFFDALKESYLLYTRWLENAIYETPDVSEKTRRRAAFWARQYLDAIAPTNYFWTNPEAAWKAFVTGGRSVADGVRRLVEDTRYGGVRMVDETAFRVGENLATTPGAVVYRNELLELIQYEPTTEKVHATPVVIVAPWINKYYVLDLNQRKSLIRFLVDQGFSVFVTSWKNPTPEMRDVTLDDYMLKGALQAVEVAREIQGAPQAHAVGYCIGGTIVAALLAWLNRERSAKDRLPISSWTALTTLVDFTDPGDIQVFITEDSIEHLEEQMQQKGYLDGADLGHSFRMLRPNSLIWHYVIRSYLYGEEVPSFDVLYWNIDTTRLPAAMHSKYLRELYLHNRLCEPDALTLGGRPMDLGRIRQPLYAVGAEQDHIAPWKETFKLCSLIGAPSRYALATSGHILGIINPPVSPPKRHHWLGEATEFDDPEAWRDAQERLPGSWWEDWATWLREQCGPKQAAPRLGSKKHPVLAPAPGTYVLEK
jgi:polyhydroxyalkanoate synthase subunit PhaC